MGKIWKYGDNVDTDVIIPARYLNTSEAGELAKHCMEDIDSKFAVGVRAGDIMVGGENFGCGSSREHAPVAIKASGIEMVIAKSFARIFFRNAINIGLVILESAEFVEDVSEGDLVEVEVEKGIIRNISIGKDYQTTAYSGSIRELIEAGGLVNYTRSRLGL